MSRRYWLFKTDPGTYAFADLLRAPQRTTRWDGVRNYQARNYLRDDVAVGDGVLFYHSQAAPPAVVGTAEVVRAGYPDPTQFEGRSTTQAAPWFAVDLRAVEAFPDPVPLATLRATPGLENMVLLRKGSRLSVQPVTAGEWRIVHRLGGRRALSG
jgi:predicted RNA-binding protein with PUA-like domain